MRWESLAGRSLTSLQGSGLQDVGSVREWSTSSPAHDDEAHAHIAYINSLRGTHWEVPPRGLAWWPLRPWCWSLPGALLRSRTHWTVL
eukprot:tig00000754_g3898.t1